MTAQDALLAAWKQVNGSHPDYAAPYQIPPIKGSLVGRATTKVTNPTVVVKRMVQALLAGTNRTVDGHKASAVLNAVREAVRQDRPKHLPTTAPAIDPTAAVGPHEQAEIYEAMALALAGGDISRLSPQAMAYTQELREKASRKAVERCLPRTQLFEALPLVEVKCADPKVGTNAIWWDGKNGTWNFGGFRVGVKKLSRLMVVTLLRGEEWVQIGDVRVTVDYLYDMVRITGLTGKFADYTDDLFNPFAARLGWRDFGIVRGDAFQQQDS